MLIWVNPIINRKFTSRYCTLVEDNLVTWRNKKQLVVAKLSVKAEYKAMILGICELIWIKKFLYR